jgi:hypothetical protein
MMRVHIEAATSSTTVAGSRPPYLDGAKRSCTMPFMAFPDLRATIETRPWMGRRRVLRHRVNRERPWLHHQSLPDPDAPRPGRPHVPGWVLLAEMLETCASIDDVGRMRLRREGALR